MLMIISLILFATAAVLGLIMATIYLRKGNLSLVLAALHGLFAASGLEVLINAVSLEKTSLTGSISLGIFKFAAAGGLLLIISHMAKDKLPKPFIIAHALAAISAFVILLISTFKT